LSEAENAGSNFRLPTKDEDGKPDKGLGARGSAQQRTDPVFLSLQKTRLLDHAELSRHPTIIPATTGHSGYSACHVIYANDRDPSHSAFYNQAGNLGRSQTADHEHSKRRMGHPIKHQFTSQIPSSHCMVCHMPEAQTWWRGYLGLTWWDNEAMVRGCIRRRNKSQPGRRTGKTESQS
jgi:hypothetical protein